MNALPVLVVLGAAALATPLEAQEPITETGQGIIVDFQNAQLASVIAALAEAAELNVVYSDLPARTVTLRLGRPVSRDALRGVLQSLVETNGLIFVDEAGLIRIEARPAEVDPGSPDPGAGGAGMQQRHVFVYRLRHAQAPRMAHTISSLFGRSPLGRRPGEVRPGGEAGPARTRQIPPVELDAEPQIQVEVGGAQTPALPGDLEDAIQIVPDELTNSLLVRATETDWEVIRSAIQALDLRPLQALIEVLIVEVRRDRNREIGVALGVIDSLSQPVTDRVDARLRSAAAGDFTLTIRDLGHLGIDAAISLLSGSGDVRILSRPVVMAQNNQEARILVGAERPFVQVFRSLPTESAIRDQIVQYRDVGTTLIITPTINPDGYVNLQVVQEVSNATAETQFGAPVISTREAATHLFVRDGQSVVIGGLIDEQRDRTRTGIPLLKDIPVLGYLFSTTRDRRIQSELFLFLTPHIVETDTDMDRINEAIESRSRMLPDLPPPLLPPGGAHPPRDSIGRDSL